MSSESSDLTSLHVRRAVGGDDASVGWLVEHLSPALHLQARYRLSGPAANFYDPVDLVQDVWAIALPRLPDLVARDGRWTPVLVRFLSTTLLHRVNSVLKAYLRGDRPQRDASKPGGDAASFEVAGLTAHGVSAAVQRNELQQAVRDAIASLDDKDRAVVVLRGIEQLSNNKVAEILDVQPSAVTMRYQKALLRLRGALPESVFAELPDDDAG